MVCRTSLLFSLLAVAPTGCSSDDDASNPGPGGGGDPNALKISSSPCTAPASGTGNVAGTLRSDYGGLIPGATIQAGTASGPVNGFGAFYVCNAPAGEPFVITARVPVDPTIGNAFAPAVDRVMPIDGEEIATVLIAKSSVLVTMTAANVAAGGPAQTWDGNLVATFPANAIATASGAAHAGDVAVRLTWFDASNANDLAAFPGDFTGTRTDQSETDLLSLGFVDVSLFDMNGAPLQLAGGSTATLDIAVDTSAIDVAETEIPLWYFDETAGEWIEEGSATINHSTGRATATVSHFTYWNVDKPVEFTDCLTGLVHDADTDTPIGGIQVQGSGQGSGISAADGTWCLNFYPNASFSLAGAGIRDGAIYTTADPVRSFTGARAGGYTCATTPNECNAMPVDQPVYVAASDLDTYCLNITIDNTAGVPLSDGELVIWDMTLGQEIYGAAPSGTSQCLPVPAEHNLDIYLSGFTGQSEWWCAITTFNGEPVAGQQGITISTGTASCPSGCDSAAMTCMGYP